jgi:hypothetical protein
MREKETKLLQTNRERETDRQTDRQMEAKVFTNNKKIVQEHIQKAKIFTNIYEEKERKGQIMQRRKRPS